MKANILFISDLHLCADRPEITQAFERFVTEQATTADSLYILGDFFEAWVGDDDDSPFIQQVKVLLKQLSRQGVKLFFMRGNRDFLLGQRFCAEVGMTLLNDPCVITIHDRQLLLTHGDYLCTDDKAHQAFRRKADNPYWRRAFLALPLFFRHWIAKKVRAKSQQRYAHNPRAIADVNQRAVEKMLQQYHVTTMIHGHTHQPATHTFTLNGKFAKRIVLAAWDEQYDFFCFS